MRLSGCILALCAFTACKTPSSSSALRDDETTPAAPQMATGPTKFFATERGNFSSFPADGSVSFMRMALPATTGDGVASSSGSSTCYQGNVTGLCAVIQKMVKRYNATQDPTSDSSVLAEVVPSSCSETGDTLRFHWSATLSYDDSTTSGDAAIGPCDMSQFAATSYLQSTDDGIPTFVPATTADSIPGGVDYFGYWAKYDQATQKYAPNLDMLECKPDPANQGKQLCEAKDGVDDYGGRFGSYCAQGSADEIRAIFERLVANSASDTRTTVTLEKVGPSKTGKTTVVAYALGEPTANFRVIRSYAMKPCATPGTSVAAASQSKLTFYFPNGSGAGSYQVISEGTNAPGNVFAYGAPDKLAAMNCGDSGCVIKNVVKSKGCYRGPSQSLCAMVKRMADNTNTEEHIFASADGKTCSVAANGVAKIGIYGLNDYANDEEASSYSGTAEIGPCQASAFADTVFVSERYDSGEEIRSTKKTKSAGQYWLYTVKKPDGTLDPSPSYYNCTNGECKYSSKSYYAWTNACYMPAGDQACQVMEQIRKNAAAANKVDVALTCKMVGTEERRMLVKLVFSGGKMNFKFKTGASIPQCQ